MTAPVVVFPATPGLEWIDPLVVIGGWMVGNLVFHRFEKHLPWGRRLAKLLLILLVLTGAGLLFGRWAYYGLIGLMAVGQSLLHAWYFPKHGINGLTAEPYDRYLELISRMKAKDAKRSGQTKSPSGAPEAIDKKKLLRRVLIRFSTLFTILPAMLLLPAGTLDFPEAWIFLGVLIFPMICILAVMLRRDPALLEKRLRIGETRPIQKVFIRLTTLAILAAFLLPGLDHRFGWSDIPLSWNLAADAVILLGSLLLYLVLRANSYASRVIEIQEGQKIISTGPYAVIRHPMYAAGLLMYLAAPVALGSWWALVPLAALPVLLIIRILNEEQMLRAELPGYKEYTEKVRFRLVPFLW